MKILSCMLLAPVGEGIAHVWDLPDVHSPHDVALVAGPLRLAKADRPVAFLIAETRSQESKLHKFILLPDGKAVAVASEFSPTSEDSQGTLTLFLPYTALTRSCKS